jgi:Arc/MetJ-type ribon-helix-helix transcriptional regulator
MVEYVNLKIPKNLADSINELIEEHPEYGYTSKVDFIKHAVRDLMYKIERGPELREAIESLKTSKE